MKQFFKIFVLAFLATSITSCGNGGNSSNINAEAPAFVATLTGVDAIQIGLSVENVPASIEGLYDNLVIETIEDEMDGDYTVLNFMLSGSTAMKAYVDYNNQISGIEVLGSHIASVDGISPGTEVKELFNKGAKSSMANDGRLSLIISKTEYSVDGLKNAGKMKLEQSYATGEAPYITADDFDKNAKVISFFIYN